MRIVKVTALAAVASIGIFQLSELRIVTAAQTQTWDFEI